MKLLILYLFFQVALEKTEEKGQCMDLVKAAYEKLQVDSVLSAEVYHLKYQSKVYMRDKETPGGNEAVSTSEILLKGREYYFRNEELEIRQDGEVLVLVQHRQKRIQFSKVDQGNWKQQHFILAQQDFLSKGQVSACNDIEVEAQACRQVIWQLSVEESKKYGISGVEFTISLSDIKVKKMVVWFDPYHQMEKIEMSFFQQDTAQSRQLLNKKPRELVFDKEGKRLNEYKGYQLIDLTKTKN